MWHFLEAMTALTHTDEDWDVFSGLFKELWKLLHPGTSTTTPTELRLLPKDIKDVVIDSSGNVALERLQGNHAVHAHSVVLAIVADLSHRAVACVAHVLLRVSKQPCRAQRMARFFYSKITV
jgi:hypothetical protein